MSREAMKQALEALETVFMPHHPAVIALRERLAQPEQEPVAFSYTNATEWARIDKDMNVVHLDMDLCAKGPHNAYTALAMAIWNKAIETEREACARVCEDDFGNGALNLADAIRARGNT
jgi:hypothetical protein